LNSGGKIYIQFILILLEKYFGLFEIQAEENLFEICKEILLGNVRAQKKIL